VSIAYNRLLTIYNSFREKVEFQPEIALVLGSGLGDYAEGIEIVAKLDYHELEGFPVSTVEGHKGRFLFGYVNQVPVVIMQGRVHYYEGYAMEDVVLPARLMKMMGAKVLFLTNAAGSVNLDYQPGDFMLITDQISSFVPSPLIGPNIEELGLRFSDMSEIYDKDLREIIKETSKEIDVPVKEGVYIQFSGPNFETAREVNMCRILGADAVGMSTACEAVAANHMGMKICGISCISNLGCGISPNALTAEEVSETADRVAPLFKNLVTASITNIAKLMREQG
jgi:purine-nucleoside phosphorylase